MTDDTPDLTGLGEYLRGLPPKRIATDDELRRLVACERWEWRAGMLVCTPNEERKSWLVAHVSPVRVVDVLGDGSNAGLVHGMEPALCTPGDGCIPVPADPATAGCLMDMLLRDRDGDVEALTFTQVADEMWPVGRCLGEAVVRVLLDGWDVVDD